ncbi:prepilin-type N-terminal cleavage/methylation domain-containing protein [Candidatus Berkelbacteria bacterium]|nr:prepilin-type N-terminal cleavage/methylation domain-containing protein [Candidatus Berkelbacteria bacterium]
MRLPFRQKAQSSTKGFSLIEVLLAATLFSLVVTALIGALFYGTQATSLAGERTRATFLADEGLEAARSIRDASFASLSAGLHGLTPQGGQWTLSGDHDTTDIFTRQIVVTDETSSRKKVTSTVTWSQNSQRPGSVGVVTYLTQWPETAGGSQGNVQGTWYYPALESTVDVQGGQSGLQVSGYYYTSLSKEYAFLITNSASNNFVVIDPAAPPESAVVTSISLSNGPTGLQIPSSNASLPYALVSSRDNSAEFQVLDITTPTNPGLVGSLDAHGPADGLSVTSTVDSAGKMTAYLGRAGSVDDNFFVIDLASPTQPKQLGSLKLNGDIKAVAFYDPFPTIAFVASSDDNQELQLVDVSDKTKPKLIATADLAGTADAVSLATYAPKGGGIYLLVGQTDGHLSVFELFNPTADSVRLTGSYDAGGAINGISVTPDQTLAFLATAAHSATQLSLAEFQVLAIGNPANIHEIGSLALPGPANGIFYAPQLDRNFVATSSNTAEFVVVKPSCTSGCQ